MEKMTNVKALTFILENVKDLPTEVVDKVKAMKDSYEKKSDNKKPTKSQEENVGYKEEILDTLKILDKPVTVTEIQGASMVLSGLSNQRVSALLRLLKDEGLVIKTTDKKKSLFSLAETTEDTEPVENAETANEQ